MATVEPKIKQIALSDGEHDINAKYIQDGSGNAKSWSDITSLVETSFDVKVLSGTLPTPNASAYSSYKNSIVLCNNGLTPTTGTYVEWVITKGGTEATPTYAWEEIGTSATDLSDYAKKGTYNTGGPNSNVTGSGGEQTANGTATVTYSKASNATGSAGGATISGSNFSFTGTKATLTLTQDYQPAGTISKPGVTLGTKATITYATGSAKSGGTASVLTGVAADGTASVLTAAIKGVSLSASETSTDGPAYISAVSGTFNTGAIKSASLDVKDTSTTGYQAVVVAQGTLSGGSATGTFNTDAIKAVSGTKNYGFSASTSNVMTAPTVSNTGVLSWTLASAGTQDAHTGTAAGTGSVAYTSPTLGSATTKYIKVATAAAGTASVSSTTNYMKVSTTAADAKATVLTGVKGNGTATVIKSDGLATSTFDNYTSASLASTPTFTGITATLSVSTEYTPDGTIGGSQTISGHTHSITLTNTSVTGEVAVAVTAHTHSLSNHTHSVTI